MYTMMSSISLCHHRLPDMGGAGTETAGQFDALTRRVHAQQPTPRASNAGMWPWPTGHSSRARSNSGKTPDVTDLGEKGSGNIPCLSCLYCLVFKRLSASGFKTSLRRVDIQPLVAGDLGGMQSACIGKLFERFRKFVTISVSSFFGGVE